MSTFGKNHDNKTTLSFAGQVPSQETAPENKIAESNLIMYLADVNRGILDTQEHILHLIGCIHSNERSKYNIHNDVSCVSCHQSPILGIRYKCLHCIEEYNMCSKCIDLMELQSAHPENHFFMRIPSSNTYNLELSRQRQQQQQQQQTTFSKT